MKKINLFGAGTICKKMLPHLYEQGYKVEAIADNDVLKQGKSIWGIPIVSPKSLKFDEAGVKELLITLKPEQADDVINQVRKFNCSIKVVDDRLLAERRSWISYSRISDLEDLILFHLLHNEKNIFYIDVGSNDPTDCSVTKLFYDSGIGRGINIEPQRMLYEQTCRERKEDINLCCGVGKYNGEGDFYVQGGLSTLLEKNKVESRHPVKERIKIKTLASICEEHIKASQKISFLKIDVEGAERDVLIGADFEKYRPAVICIEATLPNTQIPCRDKWEDLLYAARYHFVYEYGINRYYVADERSDLNCRVEPVENLRWIYNVRHALFEW